MRTKTIDGGVGRRLVLTNDVDASTDASTPLLDPQGQSPLELYNIPVELDLHRVLPEMHLPAERDTRRSYVQDGGLLPADNPQNERGRSKNLPHRIDGSVRQPEHQETHDGKNKCEAEKKPLPRDGRPGVDRNDDRPVAEA